MIYGTRITTFCIAILLSLSLAASADPVTDLKKFENNTAANADEVNANFNNVKKAVDDNYERILNFSEPKSASVTYSAMGFSPDKSEADSYEHTTEFEKKGATGSLTCLEDKGCYFYHSVSLRTGVTITQIRAHVFDAADDASIELKLQKKVAGEEIVTNLVDNTSGDSGDQVFGAKLDEPINWSSTEYPPSYFIEVFLSNSSKNILLYSVTIDFTYTAP